MYDIQGRLVAGVPVNLHCCWNREADVVEGQRGGGILRLMELVNAMNIPWMTRQLKKELATAVSGPLSSRIRKRNATNRKCQAELLEPASTHREHWRASQDGEAPEVILEVAMLETRCSETWGIKEIDAAYRSCATRLQRWP